MAFPLGVEEILNPHSTGDGREVNIRVERKLMSPGKGA